MLTSGKALDLVCMKAISHHEKQRFPPVTPEPALRFSSAPALRLLILSLAGVDKLCNPRHLKRRGEKNAVSSYGIKANV